MNESLSSKSCLLQLPLKEESSSSFNLDKAVCNHGFFMMAPNLWNPSTKTLQRPLRLADSTTSLTVSISQSSQHNLANFLLVRVHGTLHLSFADHQAILEQVARMLHISEKDERDVREFQELHSEAKMKGFGRLFRSPTLFEDAVKSILLCNCTWERTLNMAKALCGLQSELTQGLIPCQKGSEAKPRKKGLKRKQDTDYTSPKDNKRLAACATISGSEGNKEPGLGNFPISKELANLSEELLKKRCNLGYRATRILELAKSVESGRLKLEEMDQAAVDMGSSDKVYKKLMKVKGLGDFACSNILMCIGFYHKVPTDSETTRHLQKIHGKESCTRRTVEKHVKEIYEKYAPFQCLAYWFEVWEYYESMLGKLSELPSSRYHAVTGSCGSSGGETE